VQSKSADVKCCGHETLLQTGKQGPCDLGSSFVLDGDVRTPSANILRPEQAMKLVGKLLADKVEVGRDDSKGDPTAEIHETFDARTWPGAFG